MKNAHVLPEGYKPTLNLYNTQLAIKLIKDTFQTGLAGTLNLNRVSAPLFLEKSTGLNDDLNGVERPVEFDLIEQRDACIQVVQSLAKWKRYALGHYGFRPQRGLYTDMNAIRRDEYTDNLHSIYVDQWDWEKVILSEQRNLETLIDAALSIHEVIKYAQRIVATQFETLCVSPIAMTMHVITSQELEDKYPHLTPKQREETIVREHGAVCILQIGWPLKSGTSHDGRAPDYDDWNINCDLLYFHPTLDCAMEISSMGVRVDASALTLQLEKADCTNRSTLPYHRMVLNGELPLTMGGGIGQSRLCMLLLGKAHLGEVHCGVWPKNVMADFAARGVDLL